MPTEEKNPNHLINEKSPYLLQHAYNPVNWYPWGDEAFFKAKEEHKPVFLSIGYSTCHWCHVMAHESFEDEEVAKLLNDGYISIKVDKEERPDVDAVYMAVCQAFTQQGGWPLTIIMTPEKKPFFAGTYYPKKTRYQIPGIMEILNAVTNYWQKDPEALNATADEVIAHLKRNADRSDGNVSKEMIEYAIKLFKQNFDHENGGFSSKPKFPTPHNLLFLLRYADLEQDKNALAMVEKTLGQMYRGGIYDHIGFGFSRYSTDEKWLIPHFEKMLYDNALLIMVYLEAYQITKKEIYKVIAEQIIQYILREMTDENGGFYCAQDADSDGEEGKYYVFTADEIIRNLGEKEAEFFNNYYGISSEGNFEGKNILNLLDNIRFGDKNERIEPMKQKIFEYRQNRTYLHKDDKILTSWNALMITALAKAYRILGKKEYLHAAKRAYEFLEQNLADESYHLYVRYREGETSGAGHVDDYAFLIWSLLELYETEYDANFLQKAIEFNKIFINEFYDDKDGGFYLYGSNSENLIIRPKEIYDGAIPSGNSVAAYNLQKLAKITAQKSYEELADQQLKFIAANIADYPAGFAFSLIAMMYALYPSREIICVIKDDIDLQNFKISVNKLFMPNTVVLVKDEKNSQIISKIAPFTMDYPFSKSSSIYYLCANNACSAPVEELESLIIML